MTTLDPRYADLWYSVRRYYVDSFFTREVERLPNGTRVLDLGGKKVAKRGRFDIGQYPLSVHYANADPRTEPDFLCDAAAVPVSDGAYDVVICGELLEHVPHPKDVLGEAARILRPGGTLLLTAPFHCNIHADPHDYARYTDTWLHGALDAADFRDIALERQGNLFTVVADIWKRFAAHNLWPKRKVTRGVFLSALTFYTRLALRLERNQWHASRRIVRSYTTGFGVKAVKQTGGAG